jgi:hypothetical protein
MMILWQGSLNTRKPIDWRLMELDWLIGSIARILTENAL